MGQHWIKDIIDNRNAVSGLSEELVATANEAATAATEATEAATTAAANLNKIIAEGEALTNHKERLDALDTKTDATNTNVATNTSNIATNKTAIETLDATAVKAITLGDVAKEHAPEDGVANIPKAEADGTGFGVVRLATGWDDSGAVAVMSAASILEKINDSAPDLTDYAKKSDIPDVSGYATTDALTTETTRATTAEAEIEAKIPDTSSFATKDDISTLEATIAELEERIAALEDK